jgi:adenylosuccinate lyase
MQEVYQSPFAKRYSGKEMLRLFSDRTKYEIWRRLWTALAEAQKSLGLAITKEQIEELAANIENIDFARAEEYEKTTHHDVVAHIRAYGDQCPKARAIIHLGATSCYVTDNGDLIQIREGLKLIQSKLQRVILQLANFAKEYADLPCLGYTHFQPAQLTTVGKRACLWIQEFLLDFEEIELRLQSLRFLGAKGATGTQASFLTLFDGDQTKVRELDILLTKKFGFKSVFSISGQTYTRKQDTSVVYALSGFASSAHKFATDLRLLAHLKEIEEPFENEQVGSSAMPYKRNPLLSERMCGLSRFLISLSLNPPFTSSLQWLERSLDDSANRRLTISEAFLSADAILEILLFLTKNLVVYPKSILFHMEQELPFIATEDILIACVKKGGDRQFLHEKLRQHCQAVTQDIKSTGEKNNLLDRIASDPAFSISKKELEELINPRHFIGMAVEQVHEFLDQEVSTCTKS